MKALAFTVIFFSTIACNGAGAKAYVPLDAMQDPAASTRSTFLPVNPEARPFLPGARPVEVELLIDALRRKQPITIGDSPGKALNSIIRNSLRDPLKRSHMRGMLAEAAYLEKNPQWGYVRKPNATQHDIYARIPGRRGPLTGQIKTHASGDPARYARDMVDDHRSDLFIVPDDHAGALREHWRSQLRSSEDRGLVVDAANARTQLRRVRGSGSTLKELDDGVRRAGRFALREQNATYISLGAGIAMALGPDLWEWWRTGNATDQTTLRIARSLAMIASERAATFTLARFGTGALRGTSGGNAVVALAILATDAGLSIYENGGTQALRSQSFYTHLGGSVGSVALAMMVGVPVGISVTHWTIATAWWAPALGTAAGVAAGMVAGAAGYAGGETATRMILEEVNPAFLHDAENAMILDARGAVSRSITLLRTDAPH